MILTEPNIEWQLLAEEAASGKEWSDDANDVEHGGHQHKGIQRTESYRYIYELILGLAFVYGIIAFVVWQRADHRIQTLEDEVSFMQNELSIQRGESAENLNQRATRELTASLMRLPYQIQSQYLLFETSEKTAHMVDSLIEFVDAKYRQFHQDFGVPLSSPTMRLKILVDPVVEPVGSDLNTLVIPSPEIAAKRYGITEKDALQHQIMMALSRYVFEQAVSKRQIQRQWREVILGFSFYLERENGHNRSWKQDEIYGNRRRIAMTQSISTILHANIVDQDEDDQWQNQDETPYTLIDPLVEYLLETYGFEIIPPLLDAFQEHTTWDSLIPDVFEISVGEFEEGWHRYLQKNYLPEENGAG